MLAEVSEAPPPPPLLRNATQFGSQEPGTNEEIKQFAAARGFKGKPTQRGRVLSVCLKGCLLLPLPLLLRLTPGQGFKGEPAPGKSVYRVPAGAAGAAGAAAATTCRRAAAPPIPCPASFPPVAICSPSPPCPASILRLFPHPSHSHLTGTTPRLSAGLLMDKINVNGGDASPVFNFLKVASGDTSPIMWNFAVRLGCSGWDRREIGAAERPGRQQGGIRLPACIAGGSRAPARSALLAQEYSSRCQPTPPTPYGRSSWCAVTARSLAGGPL